MLDSELKAAVRGADADIMSSWKRLPFIMEQESELQKTYLAKSQSSMRNLKEQAEVAAFNMIMCELQSDQAIFKSQRALADSEGERRRGMLLETLDEFHRRAWDKIAEIMDIMTPVWHLKTKEMSSMLPGKLQPWLQEATLLLVSKLSSMHHAARTLVMNALWNFVIMTMIMSMCTVCSPCSIPMSECPMLGRSA
jgi:hypothetical protein